MSEIPINYPSELITFWFSHEHYWFTKPGSEFQIKVDREITAKFAYLLNQNIELIDSCENSTKDYHKIAKIRVYQILHHIILYDQCTRHFSRDPSFSLQPPPETYSKLACELTSLALDEHIELFLEPTHLPFLLMPYRHTFQIDKLKIVVDYTNRWKFIYPENLVIRRFYQASLRSYAKLNTALVKPSSQSDTINNSNNQFPSTINLDIICDSSTFKKTPIFSLIELDPEDLSWKNAFYRVLGKPPQTVTISLSGGSDSMICSFLLKVLGYNPIAMMINYGNRDTSDDEQKFVEWWCQQLAIPIYVRQITECKRSRGDVNSTSNSEDRQFYEIFTREIRFEMYQRLGNPTVLGHNQDDTIENIFTNLKSAKNLDNLYGMTEQSLQYGVKILRPLLSFPKSKIVEFANRYKIPYLYDSTPSWSQRGKIRDQLVPFLTTFDPELIPGLLRSATYFQELSTSYNNLIEQQDFELLADGSYQIAHHNSETTMFWQKAFQRLTFLTDQPKVKNSSIQTLIEQIHKRKICKITLSKSFMGRLTLTHLIISLR